MSYEVCDECEGKVKEKTCSVCRGSGKVFYELEEKEELEIMKEYENGLQEWD